MIEDLKEHIEKSFRRLSSEDYSAEHIRKGNDYDWPADWEGRALLAFVSLYEITGEKTACLEAMPEALPKHLNAAGYMGAPLKENEADEQSLSGHSWMLRGLTEYYKAFGDAQVLQYAKSIVENLYLPRVKLYGSYPAGQRSVGGGVSGSRGAFLNGWHLSTDIGCAYMCIDGLSAYFEVTKTAEVKRAVDVLTEGFVSIDYMRLNCQTHATLSAARGLLRMYRCTGEQKYFLHAKRIFAYYVQNGMTLTYENFNWFGRNDTWTEPCAVADSFILSLWLYEMTQDQRYQTFASRIWFNGLRFCHCANGGAGPNTCVTESQPYLQVSMYEAPFCCTMRYCEALKFAAQYRDAIVSSGDFLQDEHGRIFLGNKLLAEDAGGNFPRREEYVYRNKRLIEIPAFVENSSAKLKIVHETR